MSIATDPQPAPSLPRRGGVLVTLRALLETAALLMIVAVCAAMLVAIVRDSRSAHPAVPPPRAPAARAADGPLPTEPISLEGAQVQGSRTASVVVIEYSDFQCPYCGRFARDTLPNLERIYVKTGKVLFAFREFPLESMHPFAFGAATAAECAGEQGQFWKMHDLNFADQAHLDDPALHAKAQAQGLNREQFDRCLKGEVIDKVHADQKTGTALAIKGTPTFLLGRLQSDGRVKVLQRLSGALPIAEFSSALDALLRPSSQPKPEMR
jgi:protein-disulfide isomerase